MGPAPRLQDRPRLATSLVQLVVPAEGVGLEEPGIVGQIRLGVLASPIAARSSKSFGYCPKQARSFILRSRAKSTDTPVWSEKISSPICDRRTRPCGW